MGIILGYIKFSIFNFFIFILGGGGGGGGACLIYLIFWSLEVEDGLCCCFTSQSTVSTMSGLFFVFLG